MAGGCHSLSAHPRGLVGEGCLPDPLLILQMEKQRIRRSGPGSWTFQATGKQERETFSLQDPDFLGH